MVHFKVYTYVPVITTTFYFTGATIPSIPLQRQLNADDIKMQPSPAYVSIDNKSPQHY